MSYIYSCRSSGITHTPDDVWKKFWQTVNTFTKTLRHDPSRLYHFNESGSVENGYSWCDFYYIWSSESFHVGVIELNFMAEWRTQVVWNVLIEHQQHYLMMRSPSWLFLCFFFFPAPSSFTCPQFGSLTLGRLRSLQGFPKLLLYPFLGHGP